MTIDQVLMMLTDRDLLKDRRTSLPVATASSLVQPDGTIRGRDAEGKPIKGRIAGKSKARQLMEEAAARREAEAVRKRGRRERRRRLKQGR